MIRPSGTVADKAIFMKLIRRPSILLAAFLLFRATALAQITSLPCPAAPGAMGSSLTQAPDGTSYLSWLEPAGAEQWAMKFSRFDDAQQRWSEPHLIAQGADWMVNWADFPVLAVERERMTAVWFVNHATGGTSHHGESYRALHSLSTDGGATWSAPQPVTHESESVEFVALQPLPGGRLLAAWLDGRNHRRGDERQALYARVLGAPGPDQLVDGSVCDCCQLAFAPAPDGGAFLAYRGRTPDEIRDLQLARFDGQSWSRSGPLHADGWKISGCPVNGPQLATTGERLGAVWFTAANNQPQVLARVSADAGKSFGPVTRLDLGRPQGRVDNVMLADGSLAVIWLESTGTKTGTEGGIYLRTLRADGTLTEARLLAPSSTARLSGFPRMVPLAGSRLLLTGTRETEPTGIRTLLIALP